MMVNEGDMVKVELPGWEWRYQDGTRRPFQIGDFIQVMANGKPVVVQLHEDLGNGLVSAIVVEVKNTE